MEENNDNQLTLNEIRHRVTSKTFEWLKRNDDEEAKLKAENEDDEALYSISTFSQFFKGNEEKHDDENYLRVLEWCSSFSNPDGIGGTNVYVDDEETAKDDDNSEPSLRIKYILSEAGGGHGDDLWAAARHVANIFSYSMKCRELLAPVFTDHIGGEHDLNCHPLFGLRFIELGAGAGVPSWIAMKCGAKVVCTDQAIPDRIRCMAECAERNLREMKAENVDDLTLSYAERVRACPYDWGSPIDEILEILNEEKTGKQNLFDVVLAADCIYMPNFHSLLLNSIKMLLSKNGVALLPFALHGNVKDDCVWSIVDLAKEKGFQVEILESQQLTPQSSHMGSKRALINMIRLSF